MRFLLVAAPLFGHVGPLGAVGAHLARRGHQVTLLTGPTFAGLAERIGADFRALPEAACGAVPVDSRAHRPRVLTGRDAILAAFVRPISAQHAALTALLSEASWDAVLCDTAFLGALPTVLGQPPGERPPILGLSATPLSLVSVDCAPFGSALQPGDSPWTRMRNRQITWLLRHGPLRALQQELDAALTAHGVEPGALDYFDHAGRFDRTLHLGPAEFEYPRRELPASVRFVGPLAPEPDGVRLPDWWPDLDDRDVVHVTQGTLDNHDLGKLIGPTIRALADEPVLTVVATGGRPTSAVRAAFGGDLPDNVRLAAYLPYDRLLPRTAAVVSNGGYGGVLQSLRFGVPLVVAGASEDKPEVAARVRRVGAGIDLRTGNPSPSRVRRAVRRVLDDPTYRQRAEVLQRAIGSLGDPAATVADALERAAEERRTGGPSARPSGPGLPPGRPGARRDRVLPRTREGYTSAAGMRSGWMQR